MKRSGRAILYGAAATSFAVVALSNLPSLFSLLVYLLLFLAIWKGLLRWPDSSRGLAVFLLYSLIASGLYVWQLAAFPEYSGLAGREGFVGGADDAYFYSLVAPDLSGAMPVRYHYWLGSHLFADILRPFASFFFWLYGSLNPLDLIFLNVVGLSFIPFLVERVSFYLANDVRAARFSFWASLLCPVLISNGLILVRDGWVAAFSIGCLYGVFSRRYLLTATFVFCVAVLRLQHGMLAGASVLACMLLLKGFGSGGTVDGSPLRDGASTMVALAVLFPLLIVSPFLLGAVDLEQFRDLVSGNKLLHGFLRESSLEGGGLTYAVLSLPWYFSVPLSTLIYIFAPLFSLNGLVDQGVIVPRAFLFNMYAVASVIFAGFFVRAVLRAAGSRNRPMIILMGIFLVDMAVVSQWSMILRHKTAFMPMFYVILGYGYVFRGRSARIAGAVASAAFASVVIVYTTWN